MYDLGKKLGEGVAGKVYQATHKSSGAVVAVKTIACGWGPGAAAKVRHHMPRLVTPPHSLTYTHMERLPNDYRKTLLVVRLKSCSGSQT